jgi:hypothetical protein
MSRFQEMVRARLRDKTPNYTALAAFLKSDPSTIQKKLKEGGPSLCLDWLDSVTAFYQMTVAEMVTMTGSLFQEVKPMEAQLLGIFRDMTELERRGLLDVLDRRPPAPRRKARWGHAELTEEQQLVIDLYARSEPQAREGVLKVLRGTAKAHAKSGRSPSAGTNE